MEKLLWIQLTMLVFGFAQGQDNSHNLMPVPQSMHINGERLRLRRSFTIAITGHGSDRLYREASRALRRLDGRVGLFFRQGNLSIKDNNPGADLLLHADSAATLRLYANESYSLIIAGKQASIRAKTDLGVIRGLETFLQLLSVDEQGYYFPGLEISDWPRFPWRGLLIDVCLHWMPMDVILRSLDEMAAVKLNVLHLHLSEDQLFGVESKIYPKLHLVGAEGNYFSQEDIKKIIAYADQRGIRILPEFDVPGHCTAMLTAYPELAAVKRNYSLQRYFGVFDPSLDVTNPRTYSFLDSLFGEMCALFPDEYFHIGGDENTGKDWLRNPEILAYMKAKGYQTVAALQAEFINRLLPIIQRHGKKMMGWDEILYPGIDQNIMIQSWRGLQSLYDGARKGYDGLLSTGYYIDLIQPADYHYLNDPLPEGNPLTAAEAQRVVGGEATMWTEHVTPETIDSRLWPRTAAIAERLWSHRSVRDVPDMYRRLAYMDLTLEALGSTHLKNKSMMLRRLCNGYDTRAVETLVNVIEPLKDYARNEGDTMYNVFSPYTKIADVASPDQAVARQFRQDVARFLMEGGKMLEDSLKMRLTLWKENHQLFLEAVKRSPALQEAVVLSENLSRIASFGLEALQYQKTKSGSPAWKTKALESTAAARQQGGRCDLQVVNPIEALIKAAPDR